MNKIADQVRVVTQATKEIEAKISSDLWDRQKRWELRRDSSFEVAKSMTATIDALTAAYSFYDTENKRGGPISPGRQEKQLRLEAAFNDAASNFDNASLLAGLVCSKELQKAALELGRFVRDMGASAPTGNVESFQAHTKGTRAEKACRHHGNPERTRCRSTAYA